MMVFIDMTQCIFNLHQPLEELLWLNVIPSCDFHFTTYVFIVIVSVFIKVKNWFM